MITKILVLLLCFTTNALPEYKKYRVFTSINDMTVLTDTVRVKHWHRVGNKIYIIKADSTDMFVDYMEEFKK